MSLKDKDKGDEDKYGLDMKRFLLHWNNYLSQVTLAFDSLRSEEDLVDVTLSCEGRKVKAHRVLLSACSPYFREIFKENPCQHPVIVFRNIKYSDLEAIVDYIYKGEVSVDQDQLESFLATAQLLEIKGLTKDRTNEEEIPPENVDVTNITKPVNKKTVRSQSPEYSSVSTQLKRQKTSKDHGAESPKSSTLVVKTERDDCEDVDNMSYKDDEDADSTHAPDDEDSGSSETQDQHANTDIITDEAVVSTVEEKAINCGPVTKIFHDLPEQKKAVVNSKPEKITSPNKKAGKLVKRNPAKGVQARRVETSKNVLRQQGKKPLTKSATATLSPQSRRANIPKSLIITPTVSPASEKLRETEIAQSVEEIAVARSEDAKTPVGEELYQEQQENAKEQFQLTEPEAAEEAPDMGSETIGAEASSLEEEVKEPEFDYYGCEVCKADAKPFDRHSFTHKCPICPCLCFCAHLLKEHMRVIHGWFNVQRKFTANF